LNLASVAAQFCSKHLSFSEMARNWVGNVILHTRYRHPLISHGTEYADVPLIAKPGADVDSSRESINISAHFPPHEEYVKVGHLRGSKEIHATPVLNGSAFGFGGGIGGVGVDHHTQLDTAKLISLNPVRKPFANSPTILNW